MKFAKYLRDVGKFEFSLPHHRKIICNFCTFGKTLSSHFMTIDYVSKITTIGMLYNDKVESHSKSKRLNTQ